MRLVIVLILLQIALEANSRTFLAPPFYHTRSQYECMGKAGYDRISLNLHYDYQNVDERDYQNWQNALNAGLKVEVLFVPWNFYHIDVDTEIAFMQRKNFDFSNSRFWVNLNWMSPSGNVCSYLIELTTKMRQKLNANVGIFTNQRGWIYYFKSATGCLELSDSNLLWWYAQDFDNQPNFDSFKPFASWKVPYAKLYRYVDVCGRSQPQGYYV